MPKELNSLDRKFIMLMAVCLIPIGVYTMVTGKLGKGPMPIEGPLAVGFGGFMCFFAVVTFLYAWWGLGNRS